MSWFKKEKKEKFIHTDYVEVTDGYYKGKKGIVEMSLYNSNEIMITFLDGEIKWIPSKYLKKIEKEEEK